MITLAGLSAFGPFVTDMYLPALPSLPDAFSTTAFWIQMSMSVCMLGLAAGQLVVGPLSDKYGRRAPLLASMWLFVFATIGCVFAGDIYFFVAMRFLQGVAGAGGIVLSRSISSDKYSGLELVKFLAMIAAVHSIAPVAAPIVGGITLKFADWRAIFVCLLLLGVVLLALSYGIGESLEKSRRSKLSALDTFGLFGNVFRDRVALSYILQQGAMSAVLFTYISASPFIFENVYGLSPMAFSGVFALNAVGIGIGAWISAKFRRRRHAVVFSGFSISVFVGAAAVAIQLGAGVALVEACLFFTLLSFGIAAPAAAAIVLDSQRQNSGTAAALLGALPFFVGAMAAPAVALGDERISFSAVAFSGAVCAAVLSLIARNYQKKFGPTTAEGEN